VLLAWSAPGWRAGDSRRAAVLHGVRKDRQAMSDIIERAALAMLEYERWVIGPEAGNGYHYEGTTADAIIAAHVGGNFAEWASLAGRAIARAAELRGESATASRVRGQQAKRNDQRTGRRTIPKHARSAA
jgi:hypothetical protein